MKTWLVLYFIHDPENPLASIRKPDAFRCQADDYDHAEEQCMNAYPDADIVWLHEGDSIEDALYDYWGDIYADQ